MIENLPAFIAVALILNLSPGPDQIYVLSRTLAQGRFVGFVSSWGVCSGAFVHVFAAAFGFSLIIQSSFTAYAILKYCGAAYMAWLGIKAFRHNIFSLDQKAMTTRPSLWRVYLQGVLVDVLNPKVAIFFLAFLPQFIPASAPNQVSQFIILGSIVILIGFIWEALLVLFSDIVLGRFLQNSRFIKYLNCAMGVVFFGLALHVAFFAT